MTTQQRLNLDSARRLAASRVGITGPTQSIPYELRNAYSKELAKIILTYPDRFDAQTLANARLELGRPADTPLENYGPGAMLRDFAGEVGNQALDLGGAVAGVGEGVKTTLRLAAYALPAAALILGGIYLWRAYERAK